MTRAAVVRRDRSAIAPTLALLLLLGAGRGAAAQRATVVYDVSFPAPATHVAHVAADVPAAGDSVVELMMAAWSPGYYKIENYADDVRDLAAKAPDGAPLAVTHPMRNRWRVATRGARVVHVTYDVVADRQFVTADWVGDSLIVLNGAPTFVTLADSVRRPATVRLALPAGWHSATSLDSVAGMPDEYRAASYDELVDSPIVAGNLDVQAFRVRGVPFAVVDAGDVSGWDGARAAHDIARFVAEAARFWGVVPFRRYDFLNLFRRGGGGLEHASSTMLTSNVARGATPSAYLDWLAFVSHEFFHAYNVKRLRPVELGPFDYEHGPRTPSLWISEGLTTYYGDLMLVRSGLADSTDFLGWMSRMIGQLQNTPGRLVQTLSQSSLDAWESENSGVGMDQAHTVSYYTKGPVVGFLLDARIRRVTHGRKSLDDVMRLAYARYSGAHGFTPAQFQRVASDVAGVDLRGVFHRDLDTTEELDYAEALDWFGLRFAGGDDPKTRWRLEPWPDATAAQRAHLAALLAPDADHAPRR